MRIKALDAFGAIGGGKFRANPGRHGAELRLAGGKCLMAVRTSSWRDRAARTARTSSTVSKVDCEREAKRLDDADTLPPGTFFAFCSLKATTAPGNRTHFLKTQFCAPSSVRSGT